MDEIAPSMEDNRRAATARLNFLTLDPVAPQDVRPPILASWVRSRARVTGIVFGELSAPTADTVMFVV